MEISSTLQEIYILRISQVYVKEPVAVLQVSRKYGDSYPKPTGWAQFTCENIIEFILIVRMKIRLAKLLEYLFRCRIVRIPISHHSFISIVNALIQIILRGAEDRAKGEEDGSRLIKGGGLLVSAYY